MSQSSKPTPIAIPNDLMAKIDHASRLTSKSKQEIMRMAMEIGLEDMRRIDYDFASAIVTAARPPDQTRSLLGKHSDIGLNEDHPAYGVANTEIVAVEATQRITALEAQAAAAEAAKRERDAGASLPQSLSSTAHNTTRKPVEKKPLR